MRRSNAPTLQDVAREAGVSAMTVSVVLNGATSSARVSEATRARILEAAAKLQYRRNAVAHGLSRSRMNALGVVATVEGGDPNLYFLEVLNGILAAAKEFRQNTTVFSLSNWEKEKRRIFQSCDGRVDGMILIAPLLSAETAREFPFHTPFVTIHSNLPLPHSCNLDVDNEGGAYAVVRFLIEQGHRHILHFAGDMAQAGVRQRCAGFLRALEEAGIPCGDESIVPGHYVVRSGKDRMEALLSRCSESDLPTAIFCASDAIAYGCLEALSATRLRVPEDISLAGFDDILTARMTRPPLTTVRQPFRRMGSRAVERLLEQIRAEEEMPPVAEDAQLRESFTEVFPVELVIRESVGPPRSKPRP